MNKLLLAGLVCTGLSACGNADTTGRTRFALARPAKPRVVAQPDTVAVQALAPAALSLARVAALTKDFDTWYSYTYYNVPLSRDFKALGTNGQPLLKKAFLRQVARGKVLALLNGIEHQQPVYQLYPYAGQHPQIKTISQQFALEELRYVDQQGKPLPAFHFTDLQGKIYTPAMTKGKVLVLKCWFISCKGCVKEFPEVNALATRYQHNQDVLFISLANDTPTKLRPFMQQHPLKYAVVPGSEAYTEQKLHIQGYPTHIVVGRDGKIAHMTNSVGYLPSAIDAALQPAKGLAAK